MLSLDYIAGCIDCDGSINLGHDDEFRPMINFRQLETYRHVLEEIQETLGVGKIYNHSGTNLRMLTWQTTKHDECLLACQTLLPYLHIKRQQASNMIEALQLWESTKGKRRGAGYEHPQWVKNRIKEIARYMNVNNQTETSRRNKDIRLQAGDITINLNDFDSTEVILRNYVK